MVYLISFKLAPLDSWEFFSSTFVTSNLLVVVLFTTLLFTLHTVTNKSLIGGLSFLSGLIPAKANRSFNDNGLEIGGICSENLVNFTESPRKVTFPILPASLSVAKSNNKLIKE